MYDFDLRPLQLAELEILKDVTQFCDDNDIEYLIESGTMLGAVRHQGFIPWNDDVDICMDAKNYRKFLKLAPKGLPQKYFVQNYQTDPKMYMRWTKVRRNGTTLLEDTKVDMHWGIFIDVFAISGLSNNSLLRKVQIKMYEIYHKLMIKYFIQDKKIVTSSRLWKILYSIPESLRRCLLAVLEKIWLRDLEGKKLCLNSYDEKSIFPTSIFLHKNKYRFENLELWGPEAFDDYLTLKYGDWRTIPKPEERKDHSFSIVDLNKNYTEYLK